MTPLAERRRRRSDLAIRGLVGLVAFVGFACGIRRDDTVWSRLLLVGLLFLTACALVHRRAMGAIGSLVLVSIALFRPSELRFRGGDLGQRVSDASRVSYDLISEMMDADAS